MAPPSYQPTSRRPIAGLFRRTAHAATRWCVARGVHPDTISYASMVFAAAAALGFWQAARHPVLLLVAPLFCYGRLWCNMLDGMVALASGKASWRGEILNDLPDRASDIIIFVGVAHSGLCSPLVAYWAAILAVMTAYVGILGQAVGVQREFSGVMAKPWRMVVLHLGAWATWLGWGIASRGMTGLEIACWVVIVGCIQTIWIRLARIFVALRTKRGGDRQGSRRSRDALIFLKSDPVLSITHFVRPSELLLPCLLSLPPRPRSSPLRPPLRSVSRSTPSAPGTARSFSTARGCPPTA